MHPTDSLSLILVVLLAVLIIKNPFEVGKVFARVRIK
jgi:hypothetical protein